MTFRRPGPWSLLLLWPLLVSPGAAQAQPGPTLPQILESLRVSVDFQEAPIGEALDYLAQLGPINLRLGNDVDPDAMITFSAMDIPLGEVLDWITRLGDLAYTVRDNVLLVDGVEAIAQLEATQAVFDVRDMLRPPSPYPVPSLQPPSEEETEPVIFNEEEEGAISVDELVDLIRSSIEPESWDMEGMSLDAREGLVFVRSTPRVIGRIQDLLRDLRSRLGRTTRLDVRLLELSPAAWDQYLGGSGRPSPILDRAAWSRLVVGAAEGQEVREVARQQTTCLSGQRVSLLTGQKRNLLADLEVEVAGGAGAVAPTVATLPEGMSADLCAVASADGQHHILRIRLQYAQEITAGGRSTGGGVDLPDVRLAGAGTCVRIPDGGAVALTLSNPLPERHRGDGTLTTPLVLLVQARLIHMEDR